MKSYVIPMILVFAVLSGCASTKAPIPQSDKTEESVYVPDSNLKELVRLEKKIENMRDTMTLSFAAMDEYHIYRNTQLYAKMDMYEADLMQQKTQVDTLIYTLNSTNRYLEKLNDMPVFFGRPDLEVDEKYETPEETVAAVIQEEPAKIAEEEPEKITKPDILIPEIQVPLTMDADWYIIKFKEALNLFYLQKYSSALEIFEMLFEREPEHSFTGKTIYWTGESFYALRQYKKAYNTFEDVFNYEEYDKFDDSQLKLGFCYFKMGKNKLAIQEFRNLLTYYPNSQLTDVATRQIGIIRYYTNQ